MSIEKKFQPPKLFSNVGEKIEDAWIPSDNKVRMPWGAVLEGPPLSSHHEPQIYQGPLREEGRAPAGCLTEKEKQERNELLSSDHGPLTEANRKRLLYLLSKE